MNVVGVALLYGSAFEHVRSFGPSLPVSLCRMGRPIWQPRDLISPLPKHMISTPAIRGRCGTWCSRWQVKKACSMPGGGVLPSEGRRGGSHRGVQYLCSPCQRHLMLF